MTNAERNKIRQLQDKLLALAKKRNIPNTYQVNSYYPEPKLYQLQSCLWPNHKHIIEGAIRELSA